MKKGLLILLSLTSVITIYGCSKAPAEKEPVIVADKVTESTIAPSSADTAEDNTATLASAGNSDTSDSGNTGAETQTEVETKKLTLSIEGTQEEYTGSVYHSKLGYQITYDVDRFNPSVSGDGADYYMADNPDPELYPYVYVRISRQDKPASDSTTQNDTPSFAKYDVSGNITGYVATEFSSDVTIGGYNSKLYHFTSGKDWNSTTNNIYQIEHGDYIYEILTQTFIEAEEGYGARIQAMLDTFTFE